MAEGESRDLTSLSASADRAKVSDDDQQAGAGQESGGDSTSAIGRAATLEADGDVLWGGNPVGTDATTDEVTDGLAVVTPTGGPTVLGGSPTSDDPDETAPVSATYAATGTRSETSSQADTYQSIRAEIAGALGVAESSPEVDAAYQELVVQQRESREDARVAEHQAVIDDALANGRRVEEVIKIGDTEIHQFTEYVVGTPGTIEDARVRIGSEVVEPGIFSDTVVRTTRYFDGLDLVGQVTSEITGGKETITHVTEFTPGSIDLKPGDTRDVPAALTTAAGVAPSTWDPKADGTLGSARPSSGTGTVTTPAAPNESGGSSSTTSSDGWSAKPSAAETHDTPVHEHVPSGSGSGGSSADNSAPPSSDAAPPAASAADSATTPAAPAGTTTTTETTQHWDSATSDKDGDGERDADEWSEETHTTVEGNYTVEVEEPTDGNTQYIADDGYSSTGPLPTAQVGVGDNEMTTGGGHTMKTYSGVYGTFFGTLEHSETGNPHTVWGDYGDPNDPNATSPIQDGVGPPSVDPLILVDPDAAGGEVISTEQHDLQTSIHGGDFVNPNDPLFGENMVLGGVTNPQDTSPYEHNTDAMAQGGPGDDDPLT